MMMRSERRSKAEMVMSQAAALAQEIPEREAFIESLLCLLKRTVGFETAFAGGPSLGRSIVADAESAALKPSALVSLEGSSTHYESLFTPVFTRSFMNGVCLDREFFPSESARDNSVYYREVLQPAEVSSLACISLKWRGNPLAFIVAARHDGRAFDEDEGELLGAIRPFLEAAFVANLATSEHPLMEKLTPREREVAEMVCRGFSNREIGAMLGTSPNTVRNQTVQLFRKLEVDNRAELAALMSGRLDLMPGEPAVTRWLASFAHGARGSSARPKADVLRQAAERDAIAR